jgi:hypothetical protein
MKFGLVIFVKVKLHATSFIMRSAIHRVVTRLIFVSKVGKLGGSKLKNQLTTHLDLVVCMFSQDIYTLYTFPYQVATSYWKAQRVPYEAEE